MLNKMNTGNRPMWVVGLCIVLWAMVYIWGLLVPIFESDSAHNALIGMRMYLTNNWVDMVYRGQDYLDKPHLAFWLSGIGNWLLGITTVAYKLPSLVVAIPGIYATYRLGKRLYSPQIGRWAAWILISTQAFILAQNDVRMDAILLSMSILSTWMLFEFSLNDHRWIWLVGGCFFLAMAFSTKGMSGAAPPVIAVLSQVIFSKNWKFLSSFRWIVGIPLFFLFSAPVLYAYYLQFDLHPEKVIRGMSNISGVTFILFYQNIERMDGTSWGSAGSNDPFLFFHSLLWVLLPWSLLAYWAYGKRTIELWKQRSSLTKEGEIMTYTTILVMFTIMSISNFKLPHYLNILFPYFAILIAAQLASQKAPLHSLLLMQKGIAVILVILAIVINTWLFPITHWLVVPAALGALGLLIWEWKSNLSLREKLIGISISASLMANILLNGNFYPRLQEYSAGYFFAQKVKELHIPTSQIYPYQWNNDSFTYYTQHFYPLWDSTNNAHQGRKWIIGPKREVEQLADSLQLPIKQQINALDYRVTRLKGKFLNPVTRESACDEITLIETE